MKRFVSIGGRSRARDVATRSRAPVGPWCRSTAHRVLAASGEAFVAMRRDGRITAWNAAAERTFGWAEEEVLGRPMAELIVPPSHRDVHRAGLARYARSGEARVLGRLLRLPALHRDGHELTVEMTIDETEDDGAPLFFAFLRDVTRRDRAERSARWMADALRATQDVVITCDVHGVVTTANPAYETTFGHAVADAVGALLADVEPFRSSAVAVALMDRARAGEPGAEAELAYAHPDDGERTVHASASPILDHDGVRGAMAIVRDVTSRRAGQRRLADQLERLRAMAAPTRPSAALPAASADPITALLQTAREHLGFEVAWASSIRGDRLRFTAVEGDETVLGVEAGDEMPLEAAYCGLMLAGRIPNVVADTSANAETAELSPTLAGVTAYGGVPIVLADGSVHGTFCVAGTGDHTDVEPADARFLHVLAKLAADAIDRQRLDERNRALSSEVLAVEALLAALDARDSYTGEHSRTVVDLAVAVGRELGADQTTLEAVEQVALLHDIGKVGIPDEILQKPGPLDESEWDLMREHPAIGERIVAGIPSLAHHAPAIRAEHERWDGTGYPDGLVGEAIPLASRIGLACDAWHAMRSDRPYRRALSLEAALAELDRCAGTQFDPGVAAALRRVVDPGAGA